MANHTYYDWLVQELLAARLSLLGLIEEKDRLLYVKAPALRLEYMTQIGTFEEEVLAKELEVSLLRRKRELIQIAHNRREKVDLAAIEATLEEERAQLLTDLESQDLTARSTPALTAQDQQELQKMYRTIIQDFHPQMNPVSETQKELFERGMEAYRRQNPEAMRLIYNMLCGTDSISLQTSVSVSEGGRDEELKEITDMLITDYSLAATLYPLFDATEEDRVLSMSIENTRQNRKQLESELQKIQEVFPFNAEETLHDTKKTEAYCAELTLRLRQAELATGELNAKINEMLGGL